MILKMLIKDVILSTLTIKATVDKTGESADMMPVFGSILNAL